MTVISHDIDYSGVISSVIDELQKSNIFVLKIWTDGSEIPFDITDEEDVEFLEESVKITKGNEKTWILYGIIMVIKVLSK